MSAGFGFEGEGGGFFAELHATDRIDESGDNVGERVRLDKDFADKIAGLNNLGVGDLIEDLLALFLGGDDVVLTKDLEMLAEVGLGKIKHVLDIRDGEGLIAKQVDNFQAFGVGETFEKVGVEFEDLFIHIRLFEYILIIFLCQDGRIMMRPYKMGLMNQTPTRMVLVGLAGVFG